MLSDAAPSSGAPSLGGGTSTQLAQDVPELSAPEVPTVAEIYQSLLDKGAISSDTHVPLSVEDFARANVALTAEDYVGSTR